MGAGAEAPGGVTEALAALEVDVADEVLLRALDRAAAEFVGSDVVHLLVAHARRLSTLDYEGHPWAGLPAGVAICAVDRPRGRAVLRTARETFEALDDKAALAHAFFLEGLEDLGEGHLDTARVWWAKAHELFEDDVGATRLALAHLALGYFADGDLGRAIVAAEEALWAAEHNNDARAEAVSALYLAFFLVYAGRFARAEAHISRARRAFERVPIAHRYEAPLVDGVAGTLAALRGDSTGADIAFAAGLESSRVNGNRWYEAIIRSARATFTAREAPSRASQDAEAALAYLDSIDEQWWSQEARRAYATAHLHAGNLHAGLRSCRQLLAGDLNPLLRGQTLIVLAQIHEQAGEDDAAREAAASAVGLLDHSNAHYWAAVAECVAARVDHRHLDQHLRSARKRAATDVGDPAWTRLLRGQGQLDIAVLGDAVVTIDGRRVEFVTRAELELIAMLALSERGLRTDLIAERLWPDDDHDRVAHRVDNLISGLRHRLLPTLRLLREHGVVFLELDDHECDVRRTVTAARHHLSGHRPHPEPAILAATLQRPLLNGIAAPWIGLAQLALTNLADRVHARP